MKVVFVLLIFATNTDPGVLNVPDAYVFADRAKCESRAAALSARSARHRPTVLTQCVERVIE